MNLHLLLLSLSACVDKAPPADDTSAATDDSADSADTGEPEVESVVIIETSDHVDLEADWWPAGDGAGVAILFHMSPTTYDRSSYPLRVREALHAEGVAVLNVDRRGAGNSDGEASDAYQGDGGRLDMQAAVSFAIDQGADPARLVLIGASNGTTSVFDYVAGREEGMPQAAAVVFMSPGTYTENQNTLATDPEHWIADFSLPLLWLFPTNEPYSKPFEELAPDSWRFVEDGTEHGTNMFDGGALETSTLTELTAWVAAVQ